MNGDERCICWKQKKIDQMQNKQAYPVVRPEMLKRVDAETSLP
ncbi:MAG TPA: hypothetical protein VGB16_02295 [candidate division Zixibacteria bacterium]